MFRIDITNNCNFRCIMCQIHEMKKKSDIKFLDFDRFKKNTFGSLTDEDVNIGHTAEPTIHPDFEKFIHYIRSQTNRKIRVVTNGSNLAAFKECLIHNRCAIQVSLDSLKEKTLSEIRVGSKLDTILRNLDDLRGYGLDINIGSTILRSNYKEIELLSDYCKEKGFNFAFFPMSTRLSDGNILPLNLLRENLLFNRNDLKEFQLLFKSDRVSKHKNLVLSNNDSVSHLMCEEYSSTYMIQSTGDVYSCADTLVGNLNEHSLQDIIQSSSVIDFQDEVRKNREICEDCSYLKRCLNHSFFDMFNFFDDSIFHYLNDEWKDRLDVTHTNNDPLILRDFINFISDEVNVLHYERNAGKIRFVQISGDEDIDYSNDDELNTLLSSEDAFVVNNFDEIREWCLRSNMSKRLDKLRGVNLFIWGAGSMYYTRFADWASQNRECVLGIIDNDDKKCGSINSQGFEIFPPDVLLDAQFEAIIIASTFSKSIMNQIERMGIRGKEYLIGF